MQFIVEKAKHIRLLILDVDGVLTSGHLCYGSQGDEYKNFHVHDGLGILLIQQAGIKVAIISAKKSAALELRIKDLNIQYAYLGQEKKRPAYEKLKQQLQLADHEIAYIGDDLPDLPLLCRVGLAITVPDAPQIIRQYADWTTAHLGGKGAVREVCELIMQAQGKYQSVIQSYLEM